MNGCKHLIECNCVLPQFTRQENPPFHKFTVFSVLDDDDKVVIKFAQCPSCGVIHRVVDVCKSEIIVGREQLSSLITVDDIKLSLSKELCDVLTKHSVDLPTWEHAQFIVENERWGEFVMLVSETVNGTKQGKRLRILGRSIFKVDTFSYTDTLG